MSRRSREDLDVRIRRAWPINGNATASPLDAAQRMRTRVGERIAEGVGPDVSDTGGSSRRPVGSRRHVAMVLAGAVLVASALVVIGLVAGRLRLQDRPDDVEFADEPAPGVADEPAPGVPMDPDADVSAAAAATRRAAADVAVREVGRFWLNRDSRRFADVAAFLDQNRPFSQSMAVNAPNGDWSLQDRWNTEGTNTHLREPGGCAEIADCAEPLGAVRFVDGQYYERGYKQPTWEHVTADDGREFSTLVRAALAHENITLLDGRTVADLIERYDGGWTAVPDGPAGATRYRTADVGKAYRLATELQFGGRMPARALAANAPEIAAVQVWIDDESGLVQRVFTELRSTRDIVSHTSLSRHDITLTYGDGSPVRAPEQVSEVTIEEWCARVRADQWRTTEKWQNVCGPR